MFKFFYLSLLTILISCTANEALVTYNQNPNEIIKVYNTEANAIANSTTGRIDPVEAVSGHSGVIANVASEDIPFYIYKKFYYRFEANEPVLEFHVDWDDGEDNSSEKANIEIIKLDRPDTVAITSQYISPLLFN